MRKIRKITFYSFLWGFDPLDINAQGDFFSQIARLGEMNVCANFERNRRGPSMHQNFSIAYNFFPIENVPLFSTPLCLA